MLLELRIANLALAEDVVFRPGEGLTVLTGETGAGKSLIAGALALLTGGKADRDLVRSGEDEAWVEAVCDLSGRSDLLTDARRMGVVPGDDGILVLRREIRREGRGRVLVDGRQSSISVLQEIGRRLFAIQSQDQRRELAGAGFARDFLDDVLQLGPAKALVQEQLEAFRAVEERLAARRQDAALAAEQLDIWRYQRDELQAADLRPDEEAELTEAIAIKRHAQALLEAAGEARELLDTGNVPARELLGRAEAVLMPHAERSARLAEALERLTAAAELVGEAAGDLERFLDGFRDDPRELDDLESRKALYEELQRKYRRDVPGLLALADDLHLRVRRQDASESDLQALADEVESARQALADACGDLRERRQDGALKVATAAESRIRPLALPQLDVQLEVLPDAHDQGDIEVDGRRCRVAGHGADRVTLKVRTNPGESAGDAAEIASGGEAARIHLALTVLRHGRRQPLVWLFDEVDAGLGMDAATPVALLLRELAGTAQALCITHLATVAVHGRQHWRVAKEVAGGRTTITLESLAEDQRVDEIARQLGGEGWRRQDAAAQTDYARQLLAAARS